MKYRIVSAIQNTTIAKFYFNEEIVNMSAFDGKELIGIPRNHFE